MNKKDGWTIWIQGLSSSGKSTIAKSLKKKLEVNGVDSQILDGDTIREVLGDIFGYTADERIKAANVYRTISYLLNKSGINVIVAAITPFETIRIDNRNRLNKYMEVTLITSLEKCIERDEKGLYKKIMNGHEKNVVGYDIDFEEALKSDLYIDTGKTHVADSVDMIYNKLEKKWGI